MGGPDCRRRRECAGVGPLQSGVLNIAQREERSLVVCWVIKEKKGGEPAQRGIDRDGCGGQRKTSELLLLWLAHM